MYFILVLDNRVAAVARSMPTGVLPKPTALNPSFPCMTQRTGGIYRADSTLVLAAESTRSECDHNVYTSAAVTSAFLSLRRLFTEEEKKEVSGVLKGGYCDCKEEHEKIKKKKKKGEPIFNNRMTDSGFS